MGSRLGDSRPVRFWIKICSHKLIGQETVITSKSSRSSTMSNSEPKDENKVEIVSTLMEMPFPCVLIIGKTGTGKSTLCNRLAGLEADAELFPVSGGAVSCTQSTKMGIINLGGEKGNMVSLIDTIGFDDPNNDTDVKIIAELVSKLKKNCDHINLFLIAVNGQSPRLDGSLVAMIKIFEDMFGPQFWKQCVLVFTRIPMDKKSIKKRKGNNKGGSDDDIAGAYLKVVEERFKNGKGLQYLFLDACYDEEDDDEKSAFKEAMGLLDVMIKDAGRMPTSQVNEKVETEHKKLKNEITKYEKLKEEMDNLVVKLTKESEETEKNRAEGEAEHKRQMEIMNQHVEDMKRNNAHEAEIKSVLDKIQKLEKDAEKDAAQYQKKIDSMEAQMKEMNGKAVKSGYGGLVNGGRKEGVLTEVCKGLFGWTGLF